MQDRIKHVIVLMLENRSFDCVLGKLAGPGIDGLSGREANSYAGVSYPVWASQQMDQIAAAIPKPDPGELFVDMTAQLFGGPVTGAPPAMSGFVGNYVAQAKKGVSLDPCAVMHYFKPDQVPVISALATAFGVSDRWHASAPCQTWPNRFFAHTGTALGWVNNSHFHIPFAAPSIFRQLHDAGRSWRVYFHDVPQSLLLRDISWLAPRHYRFFGQFLVDAHTGQLPNYSFIEPRYFTEVMLRRSSNDEHPPADLRHGEALIATVYNALRTSPCWKNTLFIVTYDEHGGCFDHVPPPAAIPPDGHCQDGFAFDRYGVRVPAVIVSPYVESGSIIRPKVPATGDQPPPFDHTSIIATLRALFDLPAPLTARDAAAPDLLSALSLSVPSNDGPPSLKPAAPLVSTAQTVSHAAVAPNNLQENLTRMAASLPVQAPNVDAVAQASSPMAEVDVHNVAIAHARATANVKSFLNV